MSAFASNDLLRVYLDWEGEGWAGQYRADNPADEPLLRFSVDVKNDAGEWEELEDASYCTCVSANAPLRLQDELARLILSEYAAVVDTYPPTVSVKRLGERLSWISEDDVPDSWSDAGHEPQAMSNYSVRCVETVSYELSVAASDDASAQSLAGSILFGGDGHAAAVRLVPPAGVDVTCSVLEREYELSEL